MKKLLALLFLLLVTPAFAIELDKGAGKFLRWSTDGRKIEAVTSTLADTGNFTATGASAVERAVTAKLGDALNARDFGVTCDGATDDTAAFARFYAELIDRGGIGYIPEGTCLDDGTLLTSPSGIIIQGAGRGATIIKKKTVNSPAKPVLDITGANNVIIRDLTIDGNKTASEEDGAFNNNTNSGIRCVNCSNTVLQRLRIQKTPGFAFSFRPTNNNQSNVYVDDVQTDDTARVDFGASGTANVQINRLVSTNFHDTSAEGWVFDQGAKSGFLLANSELQGTTVMPAIGMTLRGGPEAWIIKNHINLNREGNLNGIEIGEGQRRTLIAGNKIVVAPVNAAANEAITFAVGDGGEDFLIVDNFLFSRGGTGSHFIGSDTGNIKRIVIRGNTLAPTDAGFTGHFIHFPQSPPTGLSIEGNILDGSAITGSFTFIEIDGDDSIISNNILRGRSGAETGIKINADADNWFVCGNVFKDVGTQTDFTSATNIVQCNTTAPVQDTYVVKAADESINSTTLQNNDDLVFACETNSSYTAELSLLLSADSATPDWKFGWTVPASATMFWGPPGLVGGSGFNAVYWLPRGTAETVLVLLTEGSTLSAGSLAGTHGVTLKAIVRCAGTAGNVQFQWSQNAAHGTASSILKDSYLKFRKLQ